MWNVSHILKIIIILPNSYYSNLFLFWLNYNMPYIMAIENALVVLEYLLELKELILF